MVPIAILLNPLVRSNNVLLPSPMLSLPAVFVGIDKLPIAIFLFPCVLLANASDPILVFLLPVVFLFNDWKPKEVLLSPVVFVYNAADPNTVFCLPLVFLYIDWNPIEVLSSPVLKYNVLSPIPILLLPLTLVNKALSPTATLFLPSVLLSKVEVPNAILLRLPWSNILIWPLRYVFCINLFPRTSVLSPSLIASFPITIWLESILSFAIISLPKKTHFSAFVTFAKVPLANL